MSDLNTIKYGTNEIVLASLPPISYHRLASYGLSHLLGNQMASKVVAWAEKDENKGATDEQKAAKKAEFQAAAIQALMDGTIGQHAARGPSADPLEVEMERIAKAEVVNTLKANNLKVPKGDEAVQFPDGTSKTMEAMIATRLEKHNDRIRKDAEGVLKEKARKAEKLAKNAAKDLGDL